MADAFDEQFASFHGRISAQQVACAVARGNALPALQLIVKTIRRNPGTGQAPRLSGFLAALYNGERFPFDLTDLRALDTELANACLAVLDYDRYSQAEIHTWGVIDGDGLNELLMRDGHYYSAQRRRIANEMYRDRFGDAGHDDEGLTG